jgi:hypothetical protein
MRPFALQQRRPILRSASAARSTFPAYIFKAILKTSPGPFGLALPPPVCFLSLPRVRSTCETRCQIQSSELPACTPKSPLPSRTSRSLGLIVPNLVRAGKLTIASRPIFLRSPPRRNNCLSPVRRISVPDPLLPARLIILRTSWNQTHDVPKYSDGQAE